MSLNDFDGTPQVDLHDLDLHINDMAFVDHALAIFDRWVAEGRVVPGVKPSA